MLELAYRISRLLVQKGPAYVMRRSGEELLKSADRWTGPRRRQRARRLIDRYEIDDIWMRLREAPYLCATDKNIFSDSEVASVLARADRAQRREIDLLGSGATVLAEPINWHRDYVVGLSWPLADHRSIDYVNAGQASDVKRAWELSRLQWALPLGQAYFLTGKDHYAADLARIIQHWGRFNPTGYGVNWACTMEPAIRVANLVTAFALCADAPSWQDASFKRSFVALIYDHADFIAHHLERGDINGNHYTANAAGLVFAGLFLQPLELDAGFAAMGQSILSEEIGLQILDDGVDFEAALSYHRLVWELFCYAALFLMRRGKHIEPAYRDRLIAMARFTSAYAMPRDGHAPLIGDNDDGRFLAMGDQALHDHRYLATLTGLAFDVPALRIGCGSGIQEIKWLLGDREAAQYATASPPPIEAPRVDAFESSGFYIMRHRESYVFVDSGPVGLAGRGGHGHSDLLSFDLVLAGQSIISDSGSFVYTSDFSARQSFRSTAAHNTPTVDGADIFPSHHIADLWSLDGRVNIITPQYGTDAGSVWFEAGHDAYTKLPDPVGITRHLKLTEDGKLFSVSDRFCATAEHLLESRFHLSPEVLVQSVGDGYLNLKAQNVEIRVTFPHDDWKLDVVESYISKAYGVRQERQCLLFSRHGQVKDFDLTLRVMS